MALKTCHIVMLLIFTGAQNYFLAADRGDVYIMKGHKNLKSFISLLLIQK